jgi:iron complex transport system ATP-binding protein
MNLLKPQVGTVFIENHNALELNEHDAARLRSVVLTDRVHPFNMTVMELIMLGRYPHQNTIGKSNKEDLQIVKRSAELIGIKDLLSKKFSELSDGQKQKVLLARAIAQEPKVLILDEPATHLDTKSKIEILLKLKEIAKLQKIIVIASMHEIEIAYRISDQVIVLENGSVKVVGFPEEIFTTNTINSIYSNEKAVWNDCFGTLELRANNALPSKIHVVSGCGTGIPVFRLLSRMDYPFSVGILDQVDIDFHLAKTMNVKLFSNEEPYGPLVGHHEILTHLPRTALIVDTGFPVSIQTATNIELIKKLAQRDNSRIFSIRNLNDAKKIYDSDFRVECGTICNLEEFIKNCQIL